MTLEEGNALVLKLLEKYEAVLEKDEGNPGQSIEEAYDLITVKPVPAWLSLYEEVKKELREEGLEI